MSSGCIRLKIGHPIKDWLRSTILHLVWITPHKFLKMFSFKVVLTVTDDGDLIGYWPLLRINRRWS